MSIDGFTISREEKRGDIVADGPSQEYLQWHTEQDLESIWWTAKAASLKDFTRLVRELTGDSIDSAQSTVRLDDEWPHESIPVLDAIALAQDNRDKVDFIVVDSSDESFSLCWMSPSSLGRERKDTSPYGEVSLVIKQGHNVEIITKSVESTATLHLGKNALRLVKEVSGLAH